MGNEFVHEIFEWIYKLSMKNVEKMIKLPIMPYGKIHGKQEFDDISLRVAARKHVRG